MRPHALVLEPAVVGLCSAFGRRKRPEAASLCGFAQVAARCGRCHVCVQVEVTVDRITRVVNVRLRHTAHSGCPASTRRGGLPQPLPLASAGARRPCCRLALAPLVAARARRVVVVDRAAALLLLPRVAESPRTRGRQQARHDRNGDVSSSPSSSHFRHLTGPYTSGQGSLA